jgi:beta-xylosidase
MLLHLPSAGWLALVPLMFANMRLARPTLPTPPAAWQADRLDGTYKNPVLHADYSDPDVVRVGDDYWLVSSSFNHVPGLPILHSRDLVNWELVGHALPRLTPENVFDTPQHGKGVWAPSIRFHAGKYWIYYPDPDFGIYLVTATDPRGPWSAPVLVKGGRGIIDPCPFWDDDGRVYLIHGWAASRANIKNVLTLHELDASGTKIIDDFGFVIHGDKLPGYTTLEGPKLYKRNGWYYVFAPAGGVTPGWQSVFRSRNIRGPYEDRIVLAQGASPINGPHQGALVDTPSGEWWFLHFQDKGAYGRVVHLEPVVWHDDWPLIGTGVATGAEKGEPVSTYKKPDLPVQPVATPATSDSFDSPALGVQWQWQANPRADWFSLSARPGFLRLFAQPEPKPGNLYDAPFLLMQKFPAPEFTVTTRIELEPSADGDSAGLIVFGYDYAWIGLRRIKSQASVVLGVRHEAAKGGAEKLIVIQPTTAVPRYVRVTVREGARCNFSFSVDGKNFSPIGEEGFTATVDRWVGAKVGLFAAGVPGAFADFDSFEVTPAQP